MKTPQLDTSDEFFSDFLKCKLNGNADKFGKSVTPYEMQKAHVPERILYNGGNQMDGLSQ